MTGLGDIAIKVEQLAGSGDTAHNAIPLLHEIRHALLRLADTGEATTIDLSAIPFGPGDRERLFEVLGEGEVTATVQALGESRIDETAYPGVWVVRHHAPGGDPLGTQIEITRHPSLLTTPEEDLGDAADRLAAQLELDANDNP